MAASEYRKNKRYIASIPHILNVGFGQQLRLKGHTATRSGTAGQVYD